MKIISISIAIAVKNCIYAPAIAVLSGPCLYSSAVPSYSFLTSMPGSSWAGTRQVSAVWHLP